LDLIYKQLWPDEPPRLSQIFYNSYMADKMQDVAAFIDHRSFLNFVNDFLDRQTHLAEEKENREDYIQASAAEFEVQANAQWFPDVLQAFQFDNDYVGHHRAENHTPQEYIDPAVLVASNCTPSLPVNSQTQVPFLCHNADSESSKQQTPEQTLDNGIWSSQEGMAEICNASYGVFGHNMDEGLCDLNVLGAINVDGPFHHTSTKTPWAATEPDEASGQAQAMLGGDSGLDGSIGTNMGVTGVM
jgi:hypothetical protein